AGRTNGNTSCTLSGITVKSHRPASITGIRITLLTREAALIPSVPIISPSSVPGLTPTASWHDATAGRHMFEILPVKKATYVPDTPSTGKYIIGSKKQPMATTAAYASKLLRINENPGWNPMTNEIYNGIANDINIASPKVIRPHL